VKCRRHLEGRAESQTEFLPIRPKHFMHARRQDATLLGADLTLTFHNLPFERLSAGDFERMCLWLVSREGFTRAEHLGASGSDAGRDVVAWKGDDRFVFQCKNVRSLGPAAIAREVAKLQALPADERATDIVFVLPCNVSARTRRVARARWGDDSRCHFWVGTVLDEMVKRHPDLLFEFFGITSFAPLASSLIALRAGRLVGRDATGAADLMTRRPFFAHALLPAEVFRGRGKLVATINRWLGEARDEPTNVMALVAIGGAGKTALVHEVLRRRAARLPEGGVFVWSFYENPRIDEFFASCFDYFVGEARIGPGRTLPPALQRALSESRPALLVLDGLECVQQTSTMPAIRGRLDQALRILLRGAASGLGKTKVLVTSRFPLPDLAAWKGRGYRCVEVGGLDRLSARAILKKQGVLGTAAALDDLAARVGWHALSVTVLGAYIGNYCDGDASNLPDFTLDQQQSDDPTAARLATLLDSYRAAMPTVIRDLLAVMAVFNRGVTTTTLAQVVKAGQAAVGAAAGLEPAAIERHLAQLTTSGLVSAVHEGWERRWQLHAFIRAYMKRQLPGGTAPIHDAVLRSDELSLSERPRELPRATVMLDRYEQLVEHTVGAGHVSAAFQLFWFALGHYDHLGRQLADHARGLRILSLFSADGTPEGLSEHLSLWERLGATSTWGAFALRSGDLRTAIAASQQGKRLAEEFVHEQSKTLYWDVCDEDGFVDERRLRHKMAPLMREISSSLTNLAGLYCATGQLRDARALADRAADIARPYVDHGLEFVEMWRAQPLHLLGETMKANAIISAARTKDSMPLVGTDAVVAAEHFLDLVDAKTASKLAAGVFSQEGRRHPDHRQIAARAHYVLGRAALDTGNDDAKTHYRALMKLADHTSEVEAILSGRLLGAEIHYATGECERSAQEARRGAQLANTTGHVLYEIRLRTAMASALLQLGERHAARRHARELVRVSSAKPCGYAWGTLKALEISRACAEAFGNQRDAIGFGARADDQRRRLMLR
jgi:hypothetical protein